MATFAFRKTNRLLSAGDYDKVFQNAKYRISTKEFLLLAIDNDLDSSRIGTIVSKKVAGNAVERNRIRRLQKETFRLSGSAPGVDIVLVARAPVRGKTNEELTRVLSGMWDKLATRRAQ